MMHALLADKLNHNVNKSTYEVNQLGTRNLTGEIIKRDRLISLSELKRMAALSYAFMKFD